MIAIWLLGGILIPSPAWGTACADDAVTQISASHSMGSQDADDEEEASPPDPQEALTQEIRRRLPELTSGQASYDGKTFRVHYDDPGEFEGDYSPFGKLDPAHIEFRPSHVKAKGEDGIYCFGGNTDGGVLLRPHFSGPVRMEILIQYQWIERSSHLMTLVHASPDAFWGADFGVRPVEKLSKKKKMRIRPSGRKSYNADASKWVDRTAPRTQVIQIDDAGKMSLTADADLAAEKETKKGSKSGQVGFLWNGVKFVVIELEVVGKLDRDWAARRLGIEPVPPAEKDPPEKKPDDTKKPDSDGE